MPLDVSLQNLLNAAGALVFALVGIFALGVARGSRRGTRIGAAGLAFGAPLVLSNLYDPAGDLARWRLFLTALYLLAAIPALVLAWHLVEEMPSRARRQLAAAAGLLLAGWAVSVATMLHDAAVPGATLSQARAILASRWVGFDAMIASLALVAVASGLRFRAAPDPRERRALAFLALAFGAFPLFFLAVSHARFVAPPLGEAWLWLATIVVTFAPWLHATHGTDGHWARNVLLTLVATTLGGVLFWATVLLTGGTGDTDFGTPGILRTFGALLLIVAVLKHDLLQAPLPHWSVRGGPLAAGALGTLLIVAQIAQNFLSAQYGLLMGGIVAGALLVAARPIERALEGRQGTRGPQPDAGREDAFRAAVRMALRDRRITREEELHLHRVAQHMGLPTGRAHELLVEVEREATRERG